MFTIHHPIIAQDLGTIHPTKEELIQYLGDEAILNDYITKQIITYADDTTKNKGDHKKNNN